MNPKKEAQAIIDAAVQRARDAREGTLRDPLASLPRAEPRPLGPDGQRLKAEFEQLLTAQLTLSSEERSRRHFERLMDARNASPTLPQASLHPLLDATIEAVERLRANRLSAEPKSPEALGVDLILAGEEGAFSALADLKKWNIEVRIVLLEQAETALTESLSGKDWLGRHGT